MRKYLRDWFKKGFNWLADDGSGSSLRLGMAGSRLFAPINEAEANTNSIVMACAWWAMRSFIEPAFQVTKDTKLGETEAIIGHPLVELIKRPQSKIVGQPTKMNGRRLWQGTIYSLMLDGNAYWHKIRGARGQVIALDFLPHTAVSPVSENGAANILHHYTIRINGQWIDVDPEDIVHFMDGIDPDNTLKGLSPLKSLMRQVMTDNEAGAYSHALLKHFAAPPFSVSPKGDVSITQDDADYMSKMFSSACGGENVGKAVFATAPVEITKLGFSPEEMAIDKMQLIPEQRISAVLGIPAIVAGLGAGLERSTFANMKEAREAATETFLVPKWALVCDTINDQLLPDLDINPGIQSAFAVATVRALQEDMDALHKRSYDGYRFGVLKRSEAKAMIKKPFDAADEVYYQDVLAATRPAPVQPMPGPMPADQQKALRDLASRRYAKSS